MRMLALLWLLASSAAFAEELGDRFYLGTGIGSLSYSGAYDAVPFSDTSIGLDLYGGFRLRDDLALELSYRSFDAVDLRNVVGSGVARLDITSDWHTVMFSALRQISLRDVFGWRRDWRVFGALGLYRSDIEQNVFTRTTGLTDGLRFDRSGLGVSTGALYQLGRVDLRGYVSWFGVLDDNEAHEAGVAVQLKF